MMKNTTSKTLPLFLMIMLTVSVSRSIAQTSVPFDDDRWQIDGQAHLLLQYQGKQALYLHNGVALLDGAQLKNGIIEFEIAFSGERGFAGVTWRRVNGDNFEYFYVRPHLSGNPDANQYTPEFNGISGWQLYHGAGYSAPTVYPMNRWIHVKVVSWEGQAKIYIDEVDEAAVEVPELKRAPVAGGMGLQAFLTPVYLADFRYRSLNEAPFDPIPPVDRDTPEGMVGEWEISTPFHEEELNSVHYLDDVDTGSLQWHPLRSESTGIANLARLSGVADEANTVFARLRIRSNSRQIKKVAFGYSDKVKVFVNDRLHYSGDNTYITRDYRYLGTVGLFDELYLPLEEGDNEVWFAVTEAFGGWGIMARLPDREGIRIVK